LQKVIIFTFWGINAGFAPLMAEKCGLFPAMEPKKRHFIIVDDDRDVRYFIRRVILRQFPGAGISEAGDGQQALRLYEKLGADLMVIDHDLPLLNGADLVRELRTRTPSSRSSWCRVSREPANWPWPRARRSSSKKGPSMWAWPVRCPRCWRIPDRRRFSNFPDAPTARILWTKTAGWATLPAKESPRPNKSRNP
jgi:CheY-like chemotaxis protein